MSIYTLSLSAQEENTERKNQANILFNLARYIHFPNYDNNDVIINVLGESSVIDYINVLAKKNTVCGRKVIARQSNLTNAVSCNILFIPIQNTSLLSEISLMVNESPVLVITEAAGYTNAGADISFERGHQLNSDSTMTYTYNINSIKTKKILVSVEFIGFGKN